MNVGFNSVAKKKKKNRGRKKEDRRRDSGNVLREASVTYARDKRARKTREKVIKTEWKFDKCACEVWADIKRECHV